MRQAPFVALAFLVSWFAPTVDALAADLSSLYDDATLRERQAKYDPSIRWNFENVVLGSLTPQERRQLGNVRLDVPLRGAGESRGHPLTFYAGGGVVTVPVQSVKFLDDLTLAWAYFWANDLSLEPVTDYVGMLKYRDPAEFGGRFPPPLEALGVPADSWKTDPKVDDVSQKALKSGLVWIMAHETGHIYFGHRGYAGITADEAQRHETMADEFANTVLRRIGVAPLGMAQVFMAMAHLEPNVSDFPDADAYRDYVTSKATHPVTSGRMSALADDLLRRPEDFAASADDVAAGVDMVTYVAGQIRMIGELLADADIQRSIKVKALATDLASLKRWQDQAVAAAAVTGSFQGDYAGTFGHRVSGGESEALESAMQLVQQGQTVSGRFWFGLGEGTINGIARDDRMSFEWFWGQAYGRGQLRRDPDTGRLSGTWGYEQAVDGGGTWDLSPR